MNVAYSEFSLLVFVVHAYCLDINYADEIQKFGCHVPIMVRKHLRNFLQGIFEHLRGLWAK